MSMQYELLPQSVRAAYDQRKAKQRAKQRSRDEVDAARELVATFEDGREIRKIVRRASCRRSIREFENMPGFQSVASVRSLNIQEYREIKQAPKAMPKRVQPKVEPEPPRVETWPPGFGAWEVLIRQHGKTRIVSVCVRSEADAMLFALALKGVDAAAVMRPITLEEYREAAKP